MIDIIETKKDRIVIFDEDELFHCDFCSNEINESYYILIPNMVSCKKCFSTHGHLFCNVVKHIEM